jgi:pyrrolidone-carboxylate peptidase
MKKYNDPDYIFHIGMAAGRDHYALETRARRDGYVIKDVLEQDGKTVGENRWRELGLPEVLRVGWEGQDVLARWRMELNNDGEPGWLEELERLRAKAGRSELVRLSTDAGKFFCEFILFESLGFRLLEDMKKSRDRQARKGGKVAFLHVPGATDRQAVERGVRMAEGAIRAVVGSWEEGKRAEGFA